MQVVNAADGHMVAVYEYDPYGKLLKADGINANNNPFRFSTKYWDNETGLGYWGYRYYSMEFGRWLNRDPAGELGELNLYVSFSNSSINKIDFIGFLSIELAEEVVDHYLLSKRGYAYMEEGAVEATEEHCIDQMLNILREKMGENAGLSIWSGASTAFFQGLMLKSLAGKLSVQALGDAINIALTENLNEDNLMDLIDKSIKTTLSKYDLIQLTDFVRDFIKEKYGHVYGEVRIITRKAIRGGYNVKCIFMVTAEISPKWFGSFGEKLNPGNKFTLFVGCENKCHRNSCICGCSNNFAQKVEGEYSISTVKKVNEIINFYNQN